MDPRLLPLSHILDLNTRLYLNCFVGVSDDQAFVRPSEHCNSMAFLGIHLVEARHYLAAQIGAPVESPLTHYAEGFESITEMPSLPSVDELRLTWTSISSHLKESLAALSASLLDTPAGPRSPIADPSTLGTIAFLVQHDSYHIGQLAFLRKYAGLPAMSYR